MVANTVVAELTYAELRQLVRNLSPEDRAWRLFSVSSFPRPEYDGPGAWRVASLSRPGEWHRIVTKLDECGVNTLLSCDCKAGANDTACWHVFAAKIARSLGENFGHWHIDRMVATKRRPIPAEWLPAPDSHIRHDSNPFPEW